MPGAVYLSWLASRQAGSDLRIQNYYNKKPMQGDKTADYCRYVDTGRLQR
jgi:hypothetical protein